MFVIRLQTHFGVRYYADQARMWDHSWYHHDPTAIEVKRYRRRSNAERVIAEYGSAWADFAPTVVPASCPHEYGTRGGICEVCGKEV